ncbi:MAG: FtsK/SpoIIIE domain-containing protein [Planctomycetota bacterium]
MPNRSQPFSTRNLLELLRDLQRLATERADAERALAERHEAGAKQAADARAAAIDAAEADFEKKRASADASFAGRRESLVADYQAARTGAQREYHGLRDAAEATRKQTTEEAKQRHRDEAMVIVSTYDAQKNEPTRRLEKLAEQLKLRRQERALLERDSAQILKSRGIPAKPTSDATAPEPLDEPNVDALLAAVDSETAAARDAAESLYRDRLSQWLVGPIPAAGGLVGAGLGVAGAGVAMGWAVVPLVVAAAVGGAVGAGGAWLGLRPAATRKAHGLVDEMRRHQGTADALTEQTLAAGKLRRDREATEIRDRTDKELADLGFEIGGLLAEMRQRTGQQLGEAGEVFPAKLADMRTRHEADLERLDSDLRNELAALTTARDQRLADAERTEHTELERLEQQRTRDWETLRDRWLNGYEETRRQLRAVRVACDRLFPDWSSIDYDDWDKPTGPSMGVEFGRVLLDLATVKHGVPDDERLLPEKTRSELPALVTLAEQPSLVVTAEGPARRQATDLLQAVMLRWITGQPPGKVRFTVLDPVGLGEAFNSFMHLADYEEGLIATRIWSEPRDITEQLARLTHHMETVLQRYLRSEYDTIHEYNAQAGEVAEPFQVLVVNGFPAGFSDDTARRLVTLATNGPKCGVYVMVSIDGSLRLPNDVPIEDLMADAVRLNWNQQRTRFEWDYPLLGKLPLRLAEPPAPERMVTLLKQVGRAAKDAVRVEVPFEVVAPAADGLWQRTCGDELRVPLGRAGANRLQDVRLGKGTSQHLLVAGKTGSGKSTFLHALVTSAAMHYSPRELEFYLVDFKKGVEFKSYATNNLPHARVVAIESEREFGLSVLQRLDEELSRRGELYRESGVQNLADFREKHRDVAMPRILLVIDEFQELFTEDDKLAQESTLLMDRLVRQGRAFGMHVVLGTQTLAGAYSIARSTLGQIAVRVALACSEADAHLILSDERNTAARFLSRPGEAIYNDQNGLLSANELFQVVWLPDNERSERLANVNRLREARGESWPPPVVFEGNAPADPRENEALRMRIAECGLRNDARPQGEATASLARDSAFLGDSVAIRPPTAVHFGRHGGSNLLIVGPDERSALGMLTVGGVSLAAADPSSRLVVLDATRPGDASEGVWQRVADALPEGAELAKPATAPATLAVLAAEVARREAESDESAPSIYLLIHNAGRFRDLRRSDDDFSFSMDADKPKSPDKHLAEILKSGPGVGVHALVWCDSYNAASRLFDRTTMREFALRVVMQMSAADSSNLIDTPVASTLKPHRAFFYSDETGEIEKLRPYGPPSEAWLESIGRSAAAPATPR